jgi:putative redox protein
MTDGTITTITELDRSTYKTKIYSGGHFIYSDEPENLGGTDEGMTPGALLLASLGSCTAITIRMYADRKKIALDFITIELEICNEKEMSAQTSINRKITLKGDLTSDEHTRLLEIADKCPIHKMLSNPIVINTMK